MMPVKRGHFWIWLLLWTGAIAMPGAPAHSQEIQKLSTILDTAREFLELQLADREGRTEIRIGNLDRRLRLARCDTPLEGYLPPGGRLAGNTSIGVRCNGSHAWKLYVPARVSLIETVVITRGYLPRGATLDHEHLDIAERDVTAAGHGYLTDPEQVIGKVLRQPLQEGSVVTPVMLARPQLIRRGEEVVILSQTDSFEVRSLGNALSDGAEGDRIRVKNKHSRRIIEGRVSGEGIVVVQM